MSDQKVAQYFATRPVKPTFGFVQSANYFSAMYLDILNAITPLSEQAQADLTGVVRRQPYAKNTFLLKPGSTCRYLYFIESGCLRGFCLRDGVTCSTWFAEENNVVTSAYSFLTQRPGYEGIEVLESGVLSFIHHDDLHRLYQQHPSFNLLGRLLTEQYYIELEERTQSLQLQTATERYEQLLKQQPTLVQRVNLGHLATYLGISQETLSRIRAKK
jgi:CRP/FNR family transcriptional regulator, anaerobic regulatory protein